MMTCHADECRFPASRAIRASFLAALALVLGATLAQAQDRALCDAAATAPNEGIPACTRLIETPSPGLPVADIYLRRGRGWFAKEDLAAAVRDFDEVVQRAPGSFVGYFNRGVVKHRQLDLDGALRDFMSALRITSTRPDLAKVTAQLYSNRGAVQNDKLEFDSAISDFDSALRLEPNLFHAVINRGHAFHRKRQHERAIADFTRAISLAPNEALGYVNRAAVWIDRARFERAIKDCSDALQVDPKSQLALSLRGEAYRLLGDYDKSLADHEQAILMDPGSADAYNNRGLVWRDKGEFDRAAADFSEAILRNERYDRAYANRGEIWRLKGDLPRSLLDLNKAVSLNPLSPVGLTLRGDTYRERGQIDLAILDYNEALRLLKDFVAAYAGRGVAFEEKGDVARARADFEKALSLPSDVDAEKAKPAQTIAKLHLDAIVQAQAEKAQSIKLAAAQVDARRAEGLRDSSAARAEAAKVAAAQIEAAKIQMGQKAAAEIAAAKAEALRAAATAREEAEKATAARLAELEAEVARKDAALKVGLARVETARLEAEKGQPKKVAQPDPGRRVALIIGNSAYGAVGALPNPKRDAQAMSDALRQVGFQKVNLVLDASRMELLSALKDFEDEADKADWAVIYYAGHGVQVGGENYMIPTDARLKAERDVPDEAVSLDRMLSTVTRARKLRVVILDACRDNPFEAQMRRASATRSVNRGLAPVNEPAGGTLVAFAAKAGQFAQDGKGGNSPFASALLKHLVEPGLEVNMLFRRVRDDVFSATGRQQEPYTYGSLPGESFYFAVN